MKLRSQSQPVLPYPDESPVGAHRAGSSAIKELNSLRLPVLGGIWTAAITLFAYEPVAASIARVARGDRHANPVEELLGLAVAGVFGDDDQWQRLTRNHESQRKLGWGKRRTASTFQQQDPLHSTAVYTITVYSLLRVQGLFCRRLTDREREDYCRDAAQGIGAVLAPRGRVPQSYDELRFHYSLIVERQLNFDRRFTELYEKSRDRDLAGTPIRDLSPLAARALPPGFVNVLDLADIPGDPMRTTAAAGRSDARF
ncbi:oxygenase MpaB family protein [Micromonospora sp. CPCC 205558]|uniref:oxygenase MpaB family protein n=1 Tax=Micromonospora sp. CPCC 205558 TaxID=3122403 RepID=UPI002FF128F3